MMYSPALGSNPDMNEGTGHAFNDGVWSRWDIHRLKEKQNRQRTWQGKLRPGGLFSENEPSIKYSVSRQTSNMSKRLNREVIKITRQDNPDILQSKPGSL